MIDSGPIRMRVLLISGEHVSLHGEFCEFENGHTCKIKELTPWVIRNLVAIGAITYAETLPKPPTGYNIKELS